MNLRRLNEQGIEQFTDFLDSLTSGAPFAYPSELLIDPDATEEIFPAIEVEQRTFGSRYAAAEYLFNLFKDSDLSGIERDQGLWAWLSLFYFEELCPANARGQRKPLERARYDLESGDFRMRWRHLLAGPYMIYRHHNKEPHSASILLSGPLYSISKFVSQLASRLELVTNAEILATATSLYLDTKTNKTRRGAASEGPGSVVRFVAVLNQFDKTWDLYSVDQGTLFDMLPNEFSRFKKERCTP